MTATLDVQQLILPDTPPQWPDLPQPVVDALRAGGGTLWHRRECQWRWHKGEIRYSCAAGCPVMLMEQVLARRHFLIKNEPGMGYQPRCGREGCNRRHTYLTQMCVEIPFDGTTEVIARFKQPTIATNGDEVTECLRLGALVPITRAEALILKARIRARGGHIR